MTTDEPTVRFLLLAEIGSADDDVSEQRAAIERLLGRAVEVRVASRLRRADEQADDFCRDQECDGGPRVLLYTETRLALDDAMVRLPDVEPAMLCARTASLVSQLFVLGCSAEADDGTTSIPSPTVTPSLPSLTASAASSSLASPAAAGLPSACTRLSLLAAPYRTRLDGGALLARRNELTRSSYDRAAQLLTALAGPRSLFEFHITVADDAGRGAGAFRRDCLELGVKPILIELQSGRPVGGAHQFQTGSWSAGTFLQALCQTDAQSRLLERLGWRVIRQKCEVTPSCRPGQSNCPIEPDDVVAYPPDNYFEFHVKLEIPAALQAEQLDVLRRLARRHDAHLSQNAFKTFADRQHRFLTQRIYGQPLRLAYKQLDGLVRDAEASSLRVLQVQREYAIYDTNVACDSGWIDALPPAKL